MASELGKVDAGSLVALIGAALRDGIGRVNHRADVSSGQGIEAGRRRRGELDRHGTAGGGAGDEAVNVQSVEERPTGADDAVVGQVQTHVERRGIAEALVGQRVIDRHRLAPSRRGSGQIEGGGRQIGSGFHAEIESGDGLAVGQGHSGATRDGSRRGLIGSKGDADLIIARIEIREGVITGGVGGACSARAT